MLKGPLEALPLFRRGLRMSLRSSTGKGNRVGSRRKTTPARAPLQGDEPARANVSHGWSQLRGAPRSPQRKSREPTGFFGERTRRSHGREGEPGSYTRAQNPEA